MRTELGQGRSRRGSLKWALILLALTSALIAAVEIAVFADGDAFGPVWVNVLYAGAGLTYVTAGLVGWWRRPSNGLGVIMVFGGVSWLIVSLSSFEIPALAALAVVLATLPLAVVVHLVMAFPSGRLRSRARRWTVAFGYFVCLVLEIPLYVFAPAASSNGILAAGDHPHLATVGGWIQRGAGASCVVVAVALLGAQLRRATSAQRRVLGPLYFYGLGAVLFVPVAPDVIQPLTGLSNNAIGALQVAVLIGVPLAFVAGMLLGGFARAGEIQELGAWLGANASARPSLQRALANALGDDSVRLAYWVAKRGVYIDGRGRQIELPGPGSGRAHVTIELERRCIGAIVYDAVLIADSELVAAAGRVVAIALDRERLTADLLASREALRRSRDRVLRAGDRERRRIARNLHDGLQVKLVLLALESQRLAGQAGATPAIAEAAVALRAHIDLAAAELRELVHDVMPAPLIERGLGAATRDLVDRMPVPTRLDLGVNGMLPEPVSTAAYFVVAEALTNAVKHAQASSLSVRLTHHEGALTIEVSDDGIGGVAAGDGLGLRSLADRIDVLGGRLRIDSPDGQGTQIVAELPCES